MGKQKPGVSCCSDGSLQVGFEQDQVRFSACHDPVMAAAQAMRRAFVKHRANCVGPRIWMVKGFPLCLTAAYCMGA